jgi:O-antigen/teichoic acid export membrane protein
MAAAFVAFLTVAPAAQAYLDPSTGSMILSAIIGLLATIGLALKTYWYRLRKLFRRAPKAGDAVIGSPAGKQEIGAPNRSAGNDSSPPG